MSKNFIIYLIRTLIIGVIPLVVHKYAFNTLGEVGSGSVKYIMDIATWFQLFATFGISSYAIREGSKVRDDKKKLDTFVAEMLIFNGLTTVIALLCYSVTFFVSKFDNYTTLLAIFIFYVLFCGLTLDWFYNVYEDYLYITVRTCISQILAVAFLFVFLKPNRNYVYALALVIPFVGIFIANIIGIIKKTDFKNINGLHPWQHIKFVCPMFAIVIASSIYSLLDTSMLGWMRGDAAVGFYTAASEMVKLTIKLITAVCAVFVPRLSYYIGIGEIKQYKNLANRAINIVTMIAIPAAMGLFIFSRDTILLTSNSNFLSAVNTLKILSINLIFSAVDGIIGWQVLVPNRKEKVLCIATLTGAIVDCVLNLKMIPVLNFEGAAIATLISEMCVFIICIIEAKKYIDIKPIAIHLFKCILASLPIACIGCILSRFDLSPIISFTIAVPMAAVCYMVILLLIKDEIVLSLLEYISDKISKRNDKNCVD